MAPPALSNRPVRSLSHARSVHCGDAVARNEMSRRIQGSLPPNQDVAERVCTVLYLT